MAELSGKKPSPAEEVGTSQIKDAKIADAKNIKAKPDEVDIDFKLLQEKHRHEIDMLKYGLFGKVFGAEENSSKALTFTIVFIIILAWIIFVGISILVPEITGYASDLFNVITPVITLAFGYFFGKK